MRVRKNPDWPDFYGVRARVQKSDYLGSGKDQEIRNRKFAEDDLARSGLVPEDMGVDCSGFLPLQGQAKAGYQMPFFNNRGSAYSRNGLSDMFRNRLYGGEQRYGQPTNDYLKGVGIEPNPPYCHPMTGAIKDWKGRFAILEGEKKAVSFMKYTGIPTIAIVGCWNWKKEGKREITDTLIQTLFEYKVKTILMVMDPDILTNSDVSAAYGDFNALMKEHPYTLEWYAWPNKFDDWIVEQGNEIEQKSPGMSFELRDLEIRKRFEEELPKYLFGEDKLGNSLTMLIKECDLTTTTNAQGMEKIDAYELNAYRILTRQSRYKGKLWLNMDNEMSYCYGDEVAEPKTLMHRITTDIQAQFRLKNFKQTLVGPAAERVILENPRSPFKEWLQSLKWDGKERLKDWGIRLWGMADSEYVREVCEKLIMSAAGMRLRPGTKMRWMTVLIGPQNIGKTGFAHALYGDERMVTILTSVGGNTEQEILKAVARTNCLVFDEWNVVSKRDQAYMKSLITLSTMSVRFLFREMTNVPRRCILLGTTNKEHFLNEDPTGMDRYAILKPTAMMDWKSFALEREQLWAEAVQKVMEGNIDWTAIKGKTDVEMYTMDSLINSRVDDLVEDILEKRLDKLGSEDGSPVKIKDGVYGEIVVFNLEWFLPRCISDESQRRNTSIQGQVVDRLIAKHGAQKRNMETHKGKDIMWSRVKWVYAIKVKI